MHFLRIQKTIYQVLSLLFVLTLIATVHASDALAQAAMAGTVSQVSGSVQDQRGAATIPVTQGMPVQAGDRLITGDDGHVTVLLTDQSTLELSDSSNMVVDQHQGATTRVSLASGVVRSFVNRTVGAAAPNFEVHTPNAVAAARGTLFDTAYIANVARPTYGDARNFTDVSVYEGIVDVSNILNPAAVMTIPAGYESTVSGTDNASSPGPLGMTGAISLSSPGGHTGLGSAGIMSPVSTVPPPACPVCAGPSTSPPPPAPPPPNPQ